LWGSRRRPCGNDNTVEISIHVIGYDVPVVDLVQLRADVTNTQINTLWLLTAVLRCCAAGLAVTSATVVIYGAPVVDPVQLLSHMKQPLAVCVSLFGE
jgi:hypothetical protein